MSSPAGYRVNTVVLIFTLISGVAVILRLVTRVVHLRNAGVEDLCIGLAMLLSIGLLAAISGQAMNGLGMHITELTPMQMVNSRKAFWASIWLYNLSLTFTKVSILLQYLRIFPTRRFRIVCCVVLGFVILYGLWTFLGSVFICTPVRFFWDTTVPGGKCMNELVVWFTNAGVNILQDIIILLLPMPVIRRLSIPKLQKKALTAIFALGGLVCIISIVRLRSLVRVSNSKDPTYDNPPAAAASAVEANVGIITACLPSLRPLLSALLPSYFPGDQSRFTNRQKYDEEQFKLRRSPTAASRPSIRAPKKSLHSRARSDTTDYSRTESEIISLYKDQATVAGTGTKVNGPVRQVHIRSASVPSNDASTLLNVPENAYRLEPLRLGGKSYSRPRSGLAPTTSPKLQPRPQRAPVFQKPLPITPFPVKLS